MSLNKIYKVNKSTQLIDLNKDCVNFKLQFNTECVNEDGSLNANGEYYMLIVNQSQLDDPKFDSKSFKLVKGAMGGDIVADKNVYQNYFLLLKANKDCSIKVTGKFNPNFQIEFLFKRLNPKSNPRI